MIKKDRLSLLIVVLSSVGLNLLYSPLSDLFFDDKEIFRYIGLVINKGFMPYRDVFDHKPPLIYFFNSVYWYFNPWIPWILDTLLVLFSSLLFYRLCKMYKLARPWFLPVIFNLLIRYSLVSFGNGMTREYTACFLLIFFCIMEGNARYKYYLLGLVTGFTAWMQQDALITLAPFLIYSIYAPDQYLSRKSSKKIFRITAGFITVTFPLLLYFYLNHSVEWLWKDAFLFNLHAPGAQPSLFEKLKVIKHALHEAEWEMPFYTALVLGVTAIFCKPTKPGLLYCAIFTVLLSFAAEILSGRLRAGNSFIYYLLPLSASIPILVCVIFTGTRDSFTRDETAQLVFSMLLSITLLLGTARYAVSVRILNDRNAFFNLIPEGQYLQSQSLTDYQLYVFDDSNLIYLYNYFKILAPSPWVYHYFWSWNPDWDTGNQVLYSIIRDLQFHRTLFILDNSAARINVKNPSTSVIWLNFLRNNYKPVSKDAAGRVLWKIK